jgi:chaperonin GroEL
MAPLAGDGAAREVRLARPHVIVWDAPVEDPVALARALERVRSDGARAVLIVARSFAPPALALLRRNASADLQLAVATAPHEGTQQAWALADLAALTGGRVCAPERGDRLDRLEPSALGAARRAVLGPGYLNLLTAEDETPAVARQRAAILHLMDETEDEQEWRRLQLRLGRLRQGLGVIWVGAATESERSVRLHAAEQALSRLRAATAGGVVPGGGAALLAAARHLTERAGAGDEGWAMRAVAAGLEAPARWIALNAGLDPHSAVHRVAPEAPALGLDVLTGQVRDLRAAGIVDPAATATQALRIGASTAALAITCDALVRRPIGLSHAELRP